MRSAGRPRRYVARHWLVVLRPLLRYSASREAYVLRVIGNSTGPVLRPDRRHRSESPFGGLERRTRAV